MTLPPDTVGIFEMGEINGALRMIGSSASYRVRLADEIDPQRTNIAIPNTHQKVLAYGTEFPYVRNAAAQAAGALELARLSQPVIFVRLGPN
jgi:hypothetical protein